MTNFICPYLNVRSQDHRRRLRVKAKLLGWLALIIAGLMVVSPLSAQAESDEVVYDTPTGQPVPRWASLAKAEVYARSGPSKDNKILWSYRQKGLPVQIISETREWRMVCDPDGGIAWVHKSMLRSQRYVIGTGTQKIDLLTGPKTEANVKARLRPRSLAVLDKCKNDFCKIVVGRETGWAPQTRLWGTQEAAVCRRPDPLTRL